MRYTIRLPYFPALADGQFIVTQKFVHHVLVHVIQFPLCFGHLTTLCIGMYIICMCNADVM